MGTYDFATSESECAEHGAKLVTITDDAQLKAIETEVESKIPLELNEVMLWTADSNVSRLSSLPYRNEKMTKRQQPLLVSFKPAIAIPSVVL